VSAGVICVNQMMGSGAKANRSEVRRASTPGLYLFPGRCAQAVGGLESPSRPPKNMSGNRVELLPERLPDVKGYIAGPRYPTDSRTFGCEPRYKGSGRQPQEAYPSPVRFWVVVQPPRPFGTLPNGIRISHPRPSLGRPMNRPMALACASGPVASGTGCGETVPKPLT